MLNGGRTWAKNYLDLQRMQHCDRVMPCCICDVKAMDGMLSEDLLANFYLFDATVKILKWFEHIKRSDDLSSVFDMALPGKRVRVSHSRPLKPE